MSINVPLSAVWRDVLLCNAALLDRAAFEKATDLFRDYVDRHNDRSLLKLLKAAAIGLAETILATMEFWLILWVGGWI